MATKTGRAVEEQLRRVSGRTTEHIARRFGKHFPMWIGCGYPKSGTVWLCQLMSSYLGVPHPRNYALPIAMSAVLHGHWNYDRRLPQCAYVRRDGRDVMVSLYYYNMRLISQDAKPRRAHVLDQRYQKVFGADYARRDIRENLPRFIELEMMNPTGAPKIWPDHLRDWIHGHPNVFPVSYEDLRSDPVPTLSSLMSDMTGTEERPDMARIAVEQFDFRRATGRVPGSEDRSSFMRKGIVGDWRNHFTRAAGEVFDAYAGDALVQYGYADTRAWYVDLPAT